MSDRAPQRRSRKSERGDYSPIIRSLRDGDDFQRLTAIARHVLLDLKVSFGPSGIEVHYPAALVATICETTGWSMDQVSAALTELEAAGWIEREANVVWIPDQLRCHPLMSANNERHRWGVQGHANGLPALAIVDRFRAKYAGYFIDAAREAIAGHSIAPGRPREGHEEHEVRSTNYEERRTEDGEPKTSGGGATDRRRGARTASHVTSIAEAPPTVIAHAPAAAERAAADTADPATSADVAEGELCDRLGGSIRARGIVGLFLADLSGGGATDVQVYGWVRSLIDMLDPAGGRAIPPDRLLQAMADFTVADRQRFPFNARVFRGFIESAMRGERLDAAPTARTAYRPKPGEEAFSNALAALEDL